MEGLVSVIVPVYNAELYLSKCIDSLIDQTYQNIEIILVDDGSDDHSFEICKQYAKKDRRIKLIRQKNAGSTSARKKGLSCAEGEYVAFIDSDDWVESEFCNKLYQIASMQHVDLVVSGCVKEFGDHRQIQVNALAEGIYSGKEMEEYIYPYILLQDRDAEFGILQYMCNKLYARPLITYCLNRLDEKIYDAEDVACVLDVCLNARKMAVDNSVLYHYRIHPNSICTSEIDEKYFVNAVNLYFYMKKVISGKAQLFEQQLMYVMARFMNNGTARLFGFAYDKRYGKWKLPIKVNYSGKKIALFGAGSVGKAYCVQLCDNFQTKDIQIFDNRLCGTKLYGFDVQSPCNLRNKEIDYVLIAAGNKDTQDQIYKELIYMGVAKDKIISTQPVRETDGYELTMRK